MKMESSRSLIFRQVMSCRLEYGTSRHEGNSSNAQPTRPRTSMPNRRGFRSSWTEPPIRHPILPFFFQLQTSSLGNRHDGEHRPHAPAWQASAFRVSGGCRHFGARLAANCLQPGPKVFGIRFIAAANIDTMDHLTLANNCKSLTAQASSSDASWHQPISSVARCDRRYLGGGACGRHQRNKFDVVFRLRRQSIRRYFPVFNEVTQLSVLVFAQPIDCLLLANESINTSI